MRAEIKDFWLKYEPKIILILGFILVATISFEAGVINGRKAPQNPIIIEKPAQQQVKGAASSENAPEDSKTAQMDAKNPASENVPGKDCVFMGSKNSDKYHLPTCRWAKNIKPENVVCFSSSDEAKSKGYVPDKNCIK